MPSHARFIDFEKNMTLEQYLAFGVLASLPFAAIAQQAPQKPDPLAATAPVPASTYASAFKDYRAVADEQATPDKAWRAANDEVGRLGGHAGHARGNAEAAPATPAPAQPAPMHHGHRH